MIKGESKNRGHWNIGRAFPLYDENDKVVRAVQMQVGTKFLAQPIQLFTRQNFIRMQQQQQIHESVTLKLLMMMRVIFDDTFIKWGGGGMS